MPFQKFHVNVPCPHTYLCYYQTEIYDIFVFNFHQATIIDGSISPPASFIIIEAQQQIEKMAFLQWEWQRSVITSIHNVPY